MDLSADEILAVDDSVTETVPVPEWKGEVFIKSMTGTERDEFEANLRRGGDLDLRNARAKLLVRVIVNSEGTRKFSDVQAGALGKKNAAILNRLYEVAARLCGLGEEEQAAMEGNSEEQTVETADGAASS
jgi:hypothetical protein